MKDPPAPRHGPVQGTALSWRRMGSTGSFRLQGGRAARALIAARAVAAQHGIAADGARVLRDGINVVVHLAPAPVVARVATLTPLLRPAPLRSFAREVVVAEPVQQGRTLQLWQVLLTRAEDGKLVARGQGRLQNVPLPGA